MIKFSGLERSLEKIQEKVGLVLIRIWRWLHGHDLELAIEKTDVILLTEKQKKSIFANIQVIQVEDQYIQTKQTQFRPRHLLA